MTQPLLETQFLSQREMRKLVVQHRCEEDLFPGCTVEAIHQAGNPSHEALCCTKDLLLLTDAATNDEVARIIQITHRNPPQTTRDVIQLRIGDKLYRVPMRQPLQLGGGG